jgi:hypothetical protein
MPGKMNILLSLLILAANTANAGKIVKLDRAKSVYTADDFSRKTAVKDTFPFSGYKKRFVPMQFPNGERIGVDYQDDDTEGHAMRILILVRDQVFRYEQGIGGLATEVSLSQAELVKSTNEIRLKFALTAFQGVAEVTIKDGVPGRMSVLYDGAGRPDRRISISPKPIESRK